MEELLLILFFLTLVLVFAGAMLAYLRLTRREARAEREARLEALTELRQAMRKLEERLSQVQTQSLSGAASSAVPRAMPEGAISRLEHESVVEAELRRLGFRKIRILAPAPDPASGELPVEAQKEQIEYKGRVILRDGAVIECRLQPSYEVFP